MKSFAGSITVTKEERELKSAFNADKQQWMIWTPSPRRRPQFAVPTLDVLQRITGKDYKLKLRITNSPVLTFTSALLPPAFVLLTSSQKLKTAHFPRFIRFYGRPHKFYILIFVKISQGFITGDNLADETGSHWVV